MNEKLPEIPAYSTLKLKQNENAIEIIWSNTKGNAIRYLILIIGFIWLGGWIYGEYKFFNLYLEKGLTIGILIGFVFWTIIGIYFLYAILKTVRPAKSEKILLSPEKLVFKKGSATHNTEDAEEINVRKHYRIQPLPKNVSFSKNEIGEINFTKIGKFKFLILTANGRKFEIGEFLDTKEREFIYAVLSGWTNK